jgi:cytochrome c oxidase subunit 3
MSAQARASEKAHPDSPAAPTDELGSFRAPPHAATLGLALYLAGMSIAFIWLLLGYAIMKSRPSMPDIPLPAWFWLSTGLVLIASLFIHWSWRGAAAGSTPTARHGLSGALALGVLFLVSQAFGFVALLGAHAGVPATEQLARMVFFLGLLHGLHALGGLVLGAVLLGRVLRGDVGDITRHRLGLTVAYWHFLAIVWMAMFAMFLLAPGPA